MPKIKIVMEENGRIFEGKIGFLVPNYDYTISLDSVVDGDETIRFTTGGGQTSSTEYGPLEIGAIYPIISYDDFLGNVSNKWFKAGNNLEFQLQLTATTLRINAWKYKGTTVPNGSPYNSPYDFLNISGSEGWISGKKIGLVENTIRGQKFYVFVVYSLVSDKKTSTRYMSVCGFTPNALTSNAYVNPYENDQPETVPGDPNDSGGYGSGLPEGDTIPGSDVSGWSFYSLGHGLNAYKVSDSQIETLSDFLWGKIGNAFDDGSIAGTVEGIWHRYLNYKFNPIAGLISLHRIPAELTVADSTNHDVQMAGITFDGSLSVGNVSINAPTISSSAQIKRLVTDEVRIDTPYSGFRDFSNTQIKLYIPFCGILEVDPSCCVGGSIYLIYECDNTNGNLGVQVMATNIYGYTKNVGNITGNCAIKIPLTGNDNGTGEMLGTIASNASAALSKNAAGLLAGGLKLATGMVQHNTLVAGQLSGNVGYLASMCAFLEVSYGIFLDTATTNSVTGETETAYNDILLRPSFVGGIVGQFTGVSQLLVRANSIDIATDSERAEIERLCREGIRI